MATALERPSFHFEGRVPQSLMSQFLQAIARENTGEALRCADAILEIDPSNVLVMEYESMLRDTLRLGPDPMLPRDWHAESPRVVAAWLRPAFRPLATVTDPCRKAPVAPANVGRESAIYLRHITENYDRLAAWTVFTQGHAPSEYGGHLVAGAAFDDYVLARASGRRFYHVVSSAVRGGTRTVVVTRAARSKGRFTFDPTRLSVNFIAAVGQTPSFGPHGSAPHGASS